MTAQDTRAAAVTLDLVHWDDSDATRLRDAQQAELRDRYGDEDIGHDMTGESIVAMVLARADGVPVACGALRDLGHERDDLADAHPGRVAELKRLYVLPERRGNGLSRLVLTDLEARARTLGFDRLVLETGVMQPEAIGLYLTSGYHSIENFGEYAAEVESRCFAKDLLPGVAHPTALPDGAPRPRVRPAVTSRPDTSRPDTSRPDSSRDVSLRAVEWDDPDATRLRREMFEHASLPLYPELEHVMARHGGYDADDVAQGVGVLTTLVAEVDGLAVGCASLRAARPGSPEDSAELKKLFVQASARGAGVARKLLAALEDDARSRGMTRTILQTGIRQPEAIGLYLATGYRVIEPYPPHRRNGVSLCFAKELV